MKTKLASLIVALSIAHHASAASLPVDLQSSREAVIQRYVADLQKADYQDIITLFNKNGTVVSTSHGKTDAKNFYYAFLPNIKLATTEFHQVYRGMPDEDILAARFHFTYQMKSGEQGGGEYVDEFSFTHGSDKLDNVYMFENLSN